MKRLVFGIVLSACVALPALAADSCRLTMVGEFDFVSRGDLGGIVIDAQLDGVPKKFIVDTGGVATMISEETSEELKLHRHVLEHMNAIEDYAGRPLKWIAVIPSLQIGTLHGTDVHAVIDPYWDDKSAAGAIGPDFLRQFDVEFDFAAHKMRLFAQDHCPGQVVYWTHDPVAVLPIHLDDDGHISVTVTLDGKEKDAGLDTGAPFSSLKLAGARSDFGLTPQTPGMTKAGPDEDVYDYRFKTLVIGGMTFYGPVVRLFGGPHLADDDMKHKLLIGAAELSKLRLFVSYKEKMLYATTADAH
jgi:predicted aspartyl protease